MISYEANRIFLVSIQAVFATLLLTNLVKAGKCEPHYGSPGQGVAPFSPRGGGTWEAQYGGIIVDVAFKSNSATVTVNRGQSGGLVSGVVTFRKGFVTESSFAFNSVQPCEISPKPDFDDIEWHRG